MTEKSRSRVFKKTSTKTSSYINVAVPSRIRGRPKGSKNKAKDIGLIVAKESPRLRGRPKGSKNKNKAVVAPVIPVIAIKTRGRPKGSKNKNTQEIATQHKPRKQTGSKFPEEVPSNNRVENQSTQINENHPLLSAVRWLERYTHPAELRYYRSRAAKNGTSLHTAMIADILGFFNVQNSDICKQIKKNKLTHINTTNE